MSLSRQTCPAVVAAAVLGAGVLVTWAATKLRGSKSGGCSTCAHAAASASSVRGSKVLVLHGKGLDVRGYENIELFGTTTMAEYNAHMEEWARKNGVELDIHQSNDPKVLSRLIQEAKGNGFVAIVINPGGFCRVDDSIIGVQTALASSGLPIAEVHFGNPCKRDPSTFSCVSDVLVFGLGKESYSVGIEAICKRAAGTN